MQTKPTKSPYVIFVTIILSLSLLNSCSFIQDNSNDEVQELREQVNQMETQNALLEVQITNSSNEVMDAPSPPEEDPQVQITLSTPTPESLPVDPIPAGVPIMYDGWSMTVSPELNINSYDNIWGIDIYVRNLGETNRIFRFTNAGITSSDNLGNQYEMSPICPYIGCDSCVEYYYLVKNLEIEGEESKLISSGTSGNACQHTDGINLFKGPIPLEASQIIIMFDDFGPFDGVEVVIDL